MIVSEILLTFGRRVELESSTVIEAESLRNYHLACGVPAGILASLTKHDFDSLISLVGDGLTLSIGLPNAPHLLNIRHGIPEDDIAKSIMQIAKRNNTSPLRLTLDIDKAVLLSKLVTTTDNCSWIYYFFADNLVRFLKSPLPILDGTLFVAPNVPTIVVVADAQMCYSGPLLSIIGQQDIAEQRTLPKTTDPRILQRPGKYQEIAAANLSWIGFRLDRLTPMHFMCRRVSGNPSELDAVLCMHLLHCCLIYVANRSSYDNNVFRASFSSPDQTVTIELEPDAPSSSLQTSLSRLALWPFDSDTTYRLPLLQNTVAREFSDGTMVSSYQALIQKLPHILEETRWHYRVFINQQIDKHFQEMRVVSNYVTEVIKNVSQAVDSVAKSLTDTLLATVGVIVLTLLASLVKNDIQDLIFRVGMQVYGWYLVIFQGIYRMGNIWHSFALLNSETDAQLLGYSLVFGKKRVNAVSAPLVARRLQFLFWFWLSAGIYVAVAVAIFLLASSLPVYLAQLGASTNTPTATATITASPIITPVPALQAIPTR